MIKFIKRPAVWILTYLACYFLLATVVHIDRFKYSIHGWGWLLFAYLFVTYTICLDLLTKRTRALKINARVLKEAADFFWYMGLPVSLIGTAALRPSLASYNSAALAFTLVAVVALSSGVASEVVRRLGLDKKPDAQ